jgi:fructose-bisphosphate aldolase class II
MLVTLNDLLIDARRNRYAVGLFNTVNMEMLRGVIAAAEETRSPVIIGTAEILLPFGPLEELAGMLITAAKKATVPVVVHFDHGYTPALIVKSLSLGFSSVMYDCSKFSFEENVKACVQMRQITDAFGATMEAELGHVGAGNPDIDSSVFTDVNEAQEFVERTKVDALAVSVGSAHGEYKFTPHLELDRISEIRDKIETPLVLHGGSGLSEDDFKNGIKNGICKVNIYTDLIKAAGTAVESLQGSGNLTLEKVIPVMIEEIKKAAINKMKIFGSVGKA